MRSHHPIDETYFTEQFRSSVDHLTHSMLQMCEKLVAFNAIGTVTSNLAPSFLKISTMTLFSKLIPPKDFDLSRILDIYLSDNGTEIIRKMLGIDVHIVFPVRKTQTTSRGRSINNFFNQLTLWYKDRTKKSIKLFINGNVHVTGCRTLREYVWLLSKVCQFLTMLFDSSKCVADTIDIQMINTNFQIKTGLDLNKLKRLLLADGKCATYDREVYPGLNLKVPTSYKREASILLFISGNIIITGVKHFLEVFEAYKYITHFISENKKDVSKLRPLLSEKPVRTSQYAEEFVNGYNSVYYHNIYVWSSNTSSDTNETSVCFLSC